MAGDPVGQADVYGKRAVARLRAGAYGSVLRETSAGLRLVAGLDSLEAVGVRATLRALRAEARWCQGHPRQAIELAEVAVADAERAGDLHALAIAYTALDGSFQMLGEPEKAIHERKAIEIWSQLGQMRSLGTSELNVGVQAYADGNWDEAVEWYTRAREDCLRAGDRATAAIASANLGEVLVSRGQLDEAETVLTDARRALRAAGYTGAALFAETQRARIAVERGRAAEAVAALEAIAAEAATLGPEIALETVVQLAHAYALAGNPEAGLRSLGGAGDIAGEEAALLAVSVDRVRAECLTALDRLDEAERCLDNALRGAVRQGLLYEQLLIRRARCELARRRGVAPSAEEVQEDERLLHLLGLAPSPVG